GDCEFGCVQFGVSFRVWSALWLDGGGAGTDLRSAGARGSLSVSGDRRWVEAQPWQERLRGGQEGDCGDAGCDRDVAGDQKGVCDPGGCCRAGEDAAACSGCDAGVDRDPEGAADLVAGGAGAGDHAGLVVAGAGEDADGHRGAGQAEPEAGHEHSGQQVAEVAAVGGDVGEEQQTASGQCERRPGYPAQAVLVDQLAGGAGAHAGREGERDECEPGRERAVAERELQVERAEQEQPEHETGVDEEEQQAAADGAVAEPLDAQERLRGAALADGEGGEAGDACGAYAERLRGDPAGLVGLGDRVHDGGVLPVASAAPRTSRPRQRGFSLSAGTVLRAPTASAAAAGRLTKKISRQSTSWVRRPPRRTPSAAPAPPTAPQAASAFARCWPWKLPVMIERAAGESSAAPRPWPARAAKSAAADP